MKKGNLGSVVSSGKQLLPSGKGAVNAAWQRVVRRRSFLQGISIAGAVFPAGTLSAQSTLSTGDAAILRFLAAAELIEADLWSQYNELGGVDGGNPAYISALQNLDADMPQYISDNTEDEISHHTFLNAYLVSKGAAPVNLDAYRTLPSSQAQGAQQIGRLTNLLNLNVDTSWYTRYRSTLNPDAPFNATFPQAITINNQPAIPLNDTDTPPDTAQPVPPDSPQASRMQAIANTAAFHFAFIEQGGSSLYTTMAQKVTSLEVLRIVVSIGGVEVDHFSLWHDKVGNAVSAPLAGVTDPETNLTFPDFNGMNSDDFQTNLILAEPCQFISDSLPACSVIRPSTTENAGAVAAVKAFTDDMLFAGQSQQFLDMIMGLAVAADAAQRQLQS